MLNFKRLIVYFIFSSTLFLGLIFNENSSGGAKIDHEYLLPFIKNFSLNFKFGLESFVNDQASLIHSPAFYILTGYFLKLTNSILFVKIFHILVCCLLPYLFYLIIKTKYKINNYYIFIFSLIIFLSPYFRSSAIWLLGDNLSLIFFSSSIYYFLKTRDDKSNFSNYYLCLISLIMCCYIRYYYCVFFIYFLFIFYKEVSLKSFLKALLVLFILSIPAIIYFYHIILNYNFLNKLFKYGNINYYSNSLIILSIIFFYLLPIILNKKILFFEHCKKNYKKILVIFLSILSIFLLDKLYFDNLIYFSPKGGGVFVKISNIINLDVELFISFISFISLIVIDYIFKDNRLLNYFLLICLIMCFPVFTIYQKYFDPLFYFFLFGLIQSNLLRNMITKKSKELIFVMAYFFLFFVFSSIYYSQGI